MATVILVRHGENDWVTKNRLAGWIEGVHLNENGRSQAKDAAKRLAKLPIKSIYSSPVTRCLETAEYIAKSHKLNIIELADVGEVHYGDWEGKKIKKLATKPEWHSVQYYPSRFQFPNGEALRDVQFRAVHAIETVSGKHEDDIIVIVSHADLIKLVLAHYLGVHIDLFQRIVISPASVSVLALMNNGVVRVVRVNDTGILQPPSKPPSEKK
ncbi:MAG: MSMEG_4193 family putative phosphomutase [Anaerolineae bacterium]|nr:MSMEG_4193 family putative phosphomutase [Anaerolineae bacterium]